MPTALLTSCGQSSGDSLYEDLEFNIWICIFFSLFLWIRLLLFKVISSVMLCNLGSDFCEKQLNCESSEKSCLGPPHIVLRITFIDHRQEPDLYCSHTCTQFSWSWYFLADLTSQIGNARDAAACGDGELWPALVTNPSPAWFASLGIAVWGLVREWGHRVAPPAPLPPTLVPKASSPQPLPTLLTDVCEDMEGVDVTKDVMLIGLSSRSQKNWSRYSGWSRQQL